MVRFILVTFAFLAWLFYVMSGGADFDPDRARADMSGSDPLRQAKTSGARDNVAGADSGEVTRVSLNLTSVEDVLNGTDRTVQDRRLPQSGSDATANTGSLPQVETVEITPSLVERAGRNVPEERILPSLIPGASPQGEGAADRIALDADPDFRVVTGSRVNVRGGPGTDYGVVATVVEGERVEVMESSGTGWVRVRAPNAGISGWMADFLLTEG